MQIVIDKNGFVESYSVWGGSFENGIEVDEPNDLEMFEENYSAFRFENGKLIFNKEKADADTMEQKKAEIRYHREQECFPVINRGEAWYRTLSDKQKQELQDWYQKWLDATETLIEPEPPEWLK